MFTFQYYLYYLVTTNRLCFFSVGFKDRPTFENSYQEFITFLVNILYYKKKNSTYLPTIKSI